MDYKVIQFIDIKTKKPFFALAQVVYDDNGAAQDGASDER